ncbi:Putative serine/Threonine protein kinases, partial [Klebsormidium nitens]
PAYLWGLLLGHNNLSGMVPSTLVKFDKKDILDGNPDLQWPRNNQPLGIIIGAVVAGATLLLLAICLGVLYHRKRRHQMRQAGVALEKIEDAEDGAENLVSSAGTFPSAPTNPAPSAPVLSPHSTTHAQSSRIPKPNPRQPPQRRPTSEPPVLSPQPGSRPQPRQPPKHNSPLPRYQGQYTLTELREGTDDFSDANVVGRGSFGIVYKATLSRGPNRVVAVKRLLQRLGRGDVEERSWRVEVEALEKVRHKNLVPLLGVCVDAGECLLVLEFFPHGSLGGQLHAAREGRGPALTWEERTGVIRDIARGLNYLHNDIQPPMLHRDIKAGNILLAEGPPVRACITDFGLAHLVSGAGGHVTSTMVKGTVPYMAPEYLHGGARFLSPRCDVYSFGVLCLEVLSARPVVRQLESGLVERLSETGEEYARKGRVLELIDPLLGGAYDMAEAQRYIAIALSCLCKDPSRRPSMDQVWWQLSKQAADTSVASTNQGAGSAWDLDGSGSFLSGSYDLGSRQLASTVQVESRFLTPR